MSDHFILVSSLNVKLFTYTNATRVNYTLIHTTIPSFNCIRQQALIYINLSLDALCQMKNYRISCIDVY